jgi:hypothetical protein
VALRWDLYERIPPDRALATLEAAYRRGIRLFDTAPLYERAPIWTRAAREAACRLCDLDKSRPLVAARAQRTRGQFVGELNFQTVYDYS